MATVKGTAKVDKFTVNASNVIVVTGKKSSTKKISKNGKNRIYGAAAKDTFTVKGGKLNYIYGDAGNDTITVTSKIGSGNRIYGDDAKNKVSGNDTFNINGGSKNYFYGGKGTDTFNINGGNSNYLYGGAGKDTYIIGKKKATATISDYAAGQDTLIVNSGTISSTTLKEKDVIFKANNAEITLTDAATKTIALKDKRGSYTVSKTKIKLGKDFSGTMNATKYLSTVKTIDGRNAKKANIIGNAKNNIIYANKKGGTVKGGTGKDTYILTSFTNKTRLTIDQSNGKFGDMDILQLKNVNKSDVDYGFKDKALIIKHNNGGTITVSNWDKRPISEIQFADNETLTFFDINEKIKNYKYVTISKAGTYKSTSGNDKFIASGKQPKTLLQSSGPDEGDNSTASESDNVETINGLPVTKVITISDLGIDGIDSLDLSYYNGWVQYYIDGKDMVLPMIEDTGVLYFGDDDSINKYILKDFTAEDRIFELNRHGEGYERFYLIVNSGNTVQGTNGNDIIYITRDGQSVFSNNGYEDEVVIAGYNDTTVAFSEDNTYAEVSITNGNFNVVESNGADLRAWLENASNNTVTGATFICGDSMCNNNQFRCSAGDDFITVEGTNNTIYGEGGDDHIYVNANGNEFYGGDGKDLFDIGYYGYVGGTDIIYDYEFGTDAVQVEDRSDIVNSVISGSDILLNLKCGGSVKVIGAATNGVDILDLSTGETFNPINDNYVTITESGCYNATDGNDTFIVPEKGNKDVIINGAGLKGNDLFDVSCYGGASYHLDGKNMILSMFDTDDNVTKITLKDFSAADRNVTLIFDRYDTRHLIVNTGNTIQGTNKNDIIYVTKNGQSVFSNGGWIDEVNINGYNNTTVNFSEDNNSAYIDIHDGSFNTVNANGAELCKVWLENGSNNTFVGATDLMVYMSDNNEVHGSMGNDALRVEKGSNNTVYGEAGNDYIWISASGNSFYGGAGNDIFEINLFNSTSGTDIIYDYEFDTDTIQVSDSSVITDSVISESDIILNLSNGGSVKVIGAANGISILDSSTGSTFNPLT